MEDALKRLLDAEAQAEAIIEDASRERERLINQALDEAREVEARFDANKPGMRTPFLKEAEARSEQAVVELTRKYEERQRSLRDLSARHEEEAVAAAMGLLLDPRY
jgi:V/A-type H+/Na+-transporting ATPase subunit G/H